MWKMLTREIRRWRSGNSAKEGCAEAFLLIHHEIPNFGGDKCFQPLKCQVQWINGKNLAGLSKPKCGR